MVKKNVFGLNQDAEKMVSKRKVRQDKKSILPREKSRKDKNKIK